MFAIIFAMALMQQSSPQIVTVAQGSRSGIEEHREAIVRTAADWPALWKAHGASGSPPAVDFANDMVVAVFLGTRPTGGFRVEITGAHAEAQSLVVDYVERRPGPEDIVSQALTSPFHIVRLPRHAGPVSFRLVSPPGRR
jgi:hypothetical protein